MDQTAANQWAIRDAKYKLVHDELSGADQLFDVSQPYLQVGPLPETGAAKAAAVSLRDQAKKLRGST